MSPDPIVAKALEGARLACGVEPTEGPRSYPSRVRCLAAIALRQGGWMTGPQAARATGSGDLAMLSPSRRPKIGISDEMVDDVVAYVSTEACPAVVPDFRVGHIGARAAAWNLDRVPEARRLYLEEGLGLAAVGRRLDPPLSAGRVHVLLQGAGVPTRPRGTRGPRLDSLPRKAPRPSYRRQSRRAYGTPCKLDRMKSISAKVVEWARAYSARGVPVAYLADLFDVDDQALASLAEQRP